MKKQIEIITFLAIISIGLAAFFIPAVCATGDSDGDGIPDALEDILGTNPNLWTNTDGRIYTEASVNPETINLGESTNVTLRALTNVTTEKGNVDVVLVTDLSGSMAGNRLTGAKNALKTFVGLADDKTFVGLASFSNADQLYSAAAMDLYENGNGGFNPYGDFYDSSRTTPADYHKSAYASNGYSDAHIDVSFTQDKAALNSAVDSYVAKGGTNIAGGINAAKKLLEEQGTSGHVQVIVVMSDGIATMAPIAPSSLDAYMPSDWESSDRSETGRTAAREAANVAKGQGITVYAIGFGSRADADTLKEVASSADKYYYAPTNDQLAEMYSKISVDIDDIAGARAYHVLPADLEYVEGSADIEPNVIDGNTLEWIIGELAPETPWDVTFEFEVQPQNPGTQPVNEVPNSKVTYIYGSEPGNVPFPAVFVDVKASPVADFGWTPEAPLADDEVTFTATASDPDGGDIISYDWDFGDGNTGSGETVTHNFGDGGNYTVMLTVTDDELETAEVNEVVTVISIPPVADFSITPGAPYYAGQEIRFDASDSYDPDGGSIDSYKWVFVDDDSGSNETVTTTSTEVTHAFAKGNHTITLTVTDDENEHASMTKSVVVDGNIDIQDSGNEGPYIGEELHINVTFMTPAENKYLNVTVDGYEIGKVNNANSTIFTWIPMSSGEHTIRAYLYDSNGTVYDGHQEGNYVEKTVYIKRVG